MGLLRLHHLPVTENDTGEDTIRKTCITSQHVLLRLQRLVMTSNTGTHLHLVRRRVIHHVLQVIQRNTESISTCMENIIQKGHITMIKSKDMRRSKVMV